MSRFSSHLTRLLIIRGVARALAPIAVLWGIYDWYFFDCLGAPSIPPPRFPWHALIFALLAGNYVIVYVLSWVAPALLNGPWRIRPWQTFVLLINAFLLPIQFKRYFGHLPWGFIAVTLLFFIGLYVGTAIYFYLQDHLPMGHAFAARKAAQAPPAQPSSTQPLSDTPEP